MTRNLHSAVSMALFVGALAGCQASASMNAGGGTTPPPPPPPPPATTAAPPPPADPPPPEKKPFKGDVNGSRINIPGHIVYDTGKATIKPESEPTLTQLKQFLLDNTQVTTLRIEGHTDSDGDDAMNLKLSGERALACVNWLVKNGIDRGRLIAVGFGETKPIGPNDTPANKEQNRRTEFHVAGINGKSSFLGRPADGGGTVFKLPSASCHTERARRAACPLCFCPPGDYGRPRCARSSSPRVCASSAVDKRGCASGSPPTTTSPPTRPRHPADPRAPRPPSTLRPRWQSSPGSVSARPATARRAGETAHKARWCRPPI